MNKKSVISAVVASALVLMGTGYAYWTDQLQVSTKATTGDLDVTFVDLGLYAKYGNELNPRDDWRGNWTIIDGIGETGFVSADFFAKGANYNQIANQADPSAAYEDRADAYNNVDFDAKLVNAAPITATIGNAYNAGNANGSDQINIEVNNIYPGYAQAFRTDIINVGSLAAKLSNIVVDVKNSSNANVKDMIGIALMVDSEQYVPTTYEDKEVFFLAKQLKNQLPADAFFTLGNVDFVRLSAINDPSTFKNILNNIILVSDSTRDQRMDLFIAVAMDPDAQGKFTTGSTEVMAANDDSLTQKESIEFTVDLNWDQFNAGKDANAHNILEMAN